MLLSFLVLLLTRQLAGAPISHLPSATISFVMRATPLEEQSPNFTCAEPSGRSLWDIIWSCLVTIFACTWIALHPNIPSPTDSGWCIFKRGFATMAYALIAPELMVTWAFHQYLGAQQIKQKYNEEILKVVARPKHPIWKRLIKYAKGWFRMKKINDPKSFKWTKTHGFFMQMGGFMLYEGEKPVEVLTYDKLKTLIDQKKVDILKITERSLNDRSKSDYLSKAIVVVQTTWFIIQCMARWVTGLPTTELEVVTLAFAALNTITYFLWLNKPQNVQESIKVQLKTLDRKESQVKGPTITSPEQAEPRGWFSRKLRGDLNNSKGSWYGLICFALFHVPYRIITGALHPMKKLFIHADPIESHSSRLRVPVYSREKLHNPSLLLVCHLPCLIGALFGLVHVIAWRSGPTVLERQLWRYSTLVIIIEPVLFAIATTLDSLIKSKQEVRYMIFVTRILIFFVSVPLILGLPAYLIARVVLISQAMASLRHLPPMAFCGIHWDTFIPHV